MGVWKKSIIFAFRNSHLNLLLLFKYEIYEKKINDVTSDLMLVYDSVGTVSNGSHGWPVRPTDGSPSCKCCTETGELFHDYL